MRRVFLGAVFCLLVGVTARSAHAQTIPTVIGTEDPISGFVGTIAGSNPALTVASDGEGSFDPFGAGFNISDGIQLNANWQFVSGAGWTQLPGTQTWVVPETAAGDSVGDWVFPGAFWDFSISPEFQQILEPSGAVSDVIHLINVPTANGGSDAHITFSSDVQAVPEPGALALLTGLAIPAGFFLRRRRR